jgi:hypothetical protein
MSIRSIPLMALVLVLYNVIVIFGSAEQATAVLTTERFRFPMIQPGVEWSISWGDLILLATLAVLFAEILKATYTSTASLVDHGLSMLVFIICLIEFLVVPRAATSVFFLIATAALIDVIAGYTIGIRVARRDIGFGGADH